ncbi:MAG: prepilin-type N-terminal cleavage/methylation domain-containing protein [Legionellales bacterium]|nr:prepilin-type N-terminal cleavage/methylation domain-containing protein [Legionellales bacterium]
MKNIKGFSLIEILIVIVLIAIIAVISLPNLVSSKESAIKVSMISDLRNLITAEESYYLNNQTYTSTISDLSGYQVSQGNTVNINSLTGARGWHADVFNATIEDTKYCTIFVGVDSSGSAFADNAEGVRLISGSSENSVKCTGF